MRYVWISERWRGTAISDSLRIYMLCLIYSHIFIWYLTRTRREGPAHSKETSPTNGKIIRVVQSSPRLAPSCSWRGPEAPFKLNVHGWGHCLLRTNTKEVKQNKLYRGCFRALPELRKSAWARFMSFVRRRVLTVHATQRTRRSRGGRYNNNYRSNR